jgi:DNA-binding HxlR family transcriptional regulator
MKNKEKLFSRKSPPERTARMVETIFRCKWSMTVYQLLNVGINRPGQMVKQTEGLSTKVLNECLKRNTEFGILKKINFNESPPRVEYHVTEFGKKFLEVVKALESLQLEIDK